MIATLPVLLDFMLGLVMSLFPAFFAFLLYFTSFSSVIRVSVIVNATLDCLMYVLISCDGLSASEFTLNVIMCIGVVEVMFCALLGVGVCADNSSSRACCSGLGSGILIGENVSSSSI